jgi:hypothetical protein
LIKENAGMKRLVALATIAVVAAGGSGVAVAATRDGSGHPVGRIPGSIHRVELTELDGVNSHVVRDGVVTGSRARALVKDFNALSPRPNGVYNCPADHGLRRVARFSADGNVWVASEGFCGEVAVVRDGQAQHALSDSKAFEADLKADLASIRPSRERVPGSVHHARLTYRKEPFQPVSKRNTVSGRTAASLVKAFNALTVEPASRLQCLIAGGPSDSVTFRTTSHTWVAKESACSNVVVSRDGKLLPTLIGSAKWERLVHRYL